MNSPLPSRRCAPGVGSLRRLVFIGGVALLFGASSCTLLLARPCDRDADCPSDQHCSEATGICANGMDDDGGTLSLADAGNDGGGGAARDGGHDDAGLPDGGGEGDLDAGTVDAGDLDGGLLDAGHHDGGGVDGGGADGGGADGGDGDRDAGADPLLECERYVDVAWPTLDAGTPPDAGMTTTGLAIRVAVPPFGQLTSSGDNLRFREVDGAPLPSWIETADDGGVVAWVRLPGLADLDRFVAHACDPLAPSNSDGEATFAAFGFVDGADAWDDTCLNNGDCQSTLLPTAVSGEAALRVDVDPGCGGLGSGANGGGLRAVTLDEGTYEIRGTVGASGTENGNISTVGARAILGVDGTVLTQSACGVPYQANCSSSPEELSATFTVPTPGEVDLLAFGVANAGCIRVEATFERLRVRRLLSPEPVATFVP